MSSITITVNGTEHHIDVDPDTPLLWVLRDRLALTGTKFGCGMGLCGSCTVHLNGEEARSCVTPVSSVGVQKVTTIEGLDPNAMHAVQRAWGIENVAQCGYCQTGQIMAAAALLQKNPKADEKAIDDAITNLCRCGTYQRIRRAIVRAAQEV